MYSDANTVYITRDSQVYQAAPTTLPSRQKEWIGSSPGTWKSEEMEMTSTSLKLQLIS
ncbi:hypothetical protein POX_d05420 [Penicillium oxalicum]|uniref:Uncharacterized protein n=1 Tax=Penicillium oxalicum (strain 114-2 / CGMCC 5302) TaxID=933388 RepID=S8BC12_PENO1|nr:hypothetical protein POX_d05420 [Penicillium oxalicum]EPS32417.1 hypothetical protein PDE_07377 [Penicillium oxalicum 114-2]KAI2789921.1 hypothetical protein POX_d05420 [Penicillium oxalicum]